VLEWSATMRNVATAVVAAAILAGVSQDASAQLKGHYIPGFTGLECGTQPPPSIWLELPVYIYPTDTIKNDAGQTIGGNPQIQTTFTGVSLVWVTNVKVLGANWGGDVVPADFIRARIETNSLNVPGSFAFSDLTLEPIWLGWHKPRADFTAGWSFFAPTGAWTLGGTSNSGLGMWSNDFQAGTTVNLDDRHHWTTALLSTYEIHSHKRDSPLKAGDILTVEGGTGRAFYKQVDGAAIPQVTNVGVVYYGQF
jgi:hypothetical protein